MPIFLARTAARKNSMRCLDIVSGDNKKHGVWPTPAISTSEASYGKGVHKQTSHLIQSKGHPSYV